MKNFVEKIKDFLYDATDYVLILVIVVGVVAVIGWRLDILFAKDIDKSEGDHDKPPITSVDSDKKDDDKGVIKTDDNENAEDNDTDEDADKDNTGSKDDPNIDDNDSSESGDSDNDNNTEPKPNTDEIVTVKIPSGSFPPAIANILLEKGLIDNKMDFLIKSQELKLDTKLKSGEFKIKKGTGLEELIKILAK